MWWHILGLEQNTDLKTLKRVYAKRIRELDQDQDIDEFTRVNEAYRQGVQSFSGEKTSLSVSGVSDGRYLRELHDLYHSSKRLKPHMWINLFNCMSFVEEEDFEKRYLSFFNEHYELTDEVWQIIRKKYPLMDHKEFLWKEVCSDHFPCASKELEGREWEEAKDYIKDKIKIFQTMCRMEYSLAKGECYKFMEDYGQNTDIQFYLKVIEAYLDKEVTYPDWLDLDSMSPKEIRLLEKGAYSKVLGKTSGKKTFFGLVR